MSLPLFERRFVRLSEQLQQLLRLLRQTGRSLSVCSCFQVHFPMLQDCDSVFVLATLIYDQTVISEHRHSLFGQIVTAS